MNKDEALKLALEALEQYKPALDAQTGKKPFDNAITAIKEALTQPEQEQCCYGGIAHDCHAGEGCRIVKRMKAAQPEKEPVAWKLVPIKPTDEMLKAMDECSTEGYDERLYAGHAASIYMAAVDAAPAQSAQQKPVVWMYQDKSTHEVRFQKHMRDFVDHSKTSEVPLYSESLANHELQCVCGAVWCGDEMVHTPNKSPPQRKPLSDEEIDKAWRSCDYTVPWEQHRIDIARAIEAAHGIKGEA